ncbi:hypothetical protein GDO81_013776 [Engystomops pustulosus]|uniref:Uncharacterized protein n=1 Tax=Engystomops pustulosus TaxID=76066 RepID=A0AAV7B5J8_ENGPU|nr:hypothetical protein GDO81_013776 [Engystomops pustulosus]
MPFSSLAPCLCSSHLAPQKQHMLMSLSWTVSLSVIFLIIEQSFYTDPINKS